MSTVSKNKGKPNENKHDATLSWKKLMKHTKTTKLQMAGINKYIGQTTSNFNGIKYEQKINEALNSKTSANHNIAGLWKIKNLANKEIETNTRKQGNQKRAKFNGINLNTPWNTIVIANTIAIHILI